MKPRALGPEREQAHDREDEQEGDAGEAEQARRATALVRDHRLEEAQRELRQAPRRGSTIAVCHTGRLREAEEGRLREVPEPDVDREAREEQVHRCAPAPAAARRPRWRSPARRTRAWSASGCCSRHRMVAEARPRCEARIERAPTPTPCGSPGGCRPGSRGWARGPSCRRRRSGPAAEASWCRRSDHCLASTARPARGPWARRAGSRAPC